MDVLLAHEAPGDLWGLGIGVPGPVEFRTGHPISPPIMPGWEGYPVREYFIAALEDVWAFINDDLFPLFVSVADFLSATLSLAIEALAGLWQNVLLPALEDVWTFISEDLKPVWEALKGVFDDVSGAVQTVIDWLSKAADSLRNLELPDWLTPGSPPPLFFALQAVARAMRALSAVELPRLQALQILPGAGKPSPLQYLPVLKQVQAAGKRLHISIPAGEVQDALSQLSARGLFISTSCDTEDEARQLLAKAETWSRD